MVVNNKVDGYFNRRVTTTRVLNFFELILKALSVNAALYIAFKHCFQVPCATVLEANFGCE